VTAFHKLLHYLAGSATLAAISAFSVPIFARVLGPENYGIVGVFTSMAGLAVPIASGNLYSAASRAYFFSHERFGEYIGTILVSFLLLFAVFGLVLLLLQERFAALIGRDLLLWLWVFVVGEALFRLFEQVSVAEGASFRLEGTRVVRALMILALSLVLVLTGDRSTATGRVIGIALTTAAAATVLTITLVKRWQPTVSGNAIKFVFSYGVPLVPASLSTVILSFFDRIMIRGMIGPEEAGLYSFAYNVGFVVSMAGAALSRFILPHYYAACRDGDGRKVNGLALAAGGTVAVATSCLMVLAPYAGLILGGEQYEGAFGAIVWVAAAYAVMFMANVIAMSINYSKRTYWLTMATFVAALLNVLLNLALIPVLGYHVAAVTTFASFVVLIVGYMLATRIGIGTTPRPSAWVPAVALAPLGVAGVAAAVLNAARLSLSASIAARGVLCALLVGGGLVFFARLRRITI